MWLEYTVKVDKKKDKSTLEKLIDGETYDFMELCNYSIILLLNIQMTQIISVLVIAVQNEHE